MRLRATRAGLIALMASALACGSAAAQPASGPREDLDQSFTAKRANAATGVDFSARYHAPGRPDADPPYMRRMVFFPPRGFRYDTAVPERCTADALDLQARGPAACPVGSMIGIGMAEGVFFAPVTHAFEIDRFKHNLYVMNGAEEQIILVEAEGYAVVRGKFQPDGSIEFKSQTCFPAPPTGDCVDDYVLQTASRTAIPRYTKTVDGRTRSYATTPPRCPKRRYWASRIRFEWKDGAVDDVVSRQPCRRSRRG